ncbi:MAG: hypothetical protein JNG88_14450 [Phycisphaerales bacterium]|nr:hypothetical protein [Phycisphaerales bacterium]
MTMNGDFMRLSRATSTVILGCAVATLMFSACAPQRRAGQFPDPVIREAMRKEHHRQIRRIAWSQLADVTRRVNAKEWEWQTWIGKNNLLGNRVWEGDLGELGPPLQLNVAPLSESTAKLLDQQSRRAVQIQDDNGVGYSSSSVAGGTHICKPRPTAFFGAAIGQEVRYDPCAENHILSEKLNDAAHLRYLTNRNSLSDQSREIPQFPFGARVVKAIWWPIQQSKGKPYERTYSCVPVWDDDPPRPTGAGSGGVGHLQVGNDAFRWDRRVAIETDPARAKEVSFATVKRLNWAVLGIHHVTEQLPVVSIENLFYYKLNAIDLKPGNVPDSTSTMTVVPVPAKTLKLMFNTIYNEDPKEGDFLVLVGFHLMAQEHEDWMWTTIWWHQRPNNGPYSKDRTDDVIGPLRNYLMDVSYMDDTPRGYNRAERPQFNPWLEAPLINGVISNCIACHQYAAWPASPNDPLSDVRLGDIAHDDEFFRNRLRLDYLFSLREVGDTP